MPFKSQAQREKFRAMVADGNLTQGKFDEWERDTPDKLPERLTPKRQSMKVAHRKHRR